MSKLKSACEKIARLGGRSYFVGGMVRDKLLNKESKDCDIEVFGLTLNQLESALLEFGVPLLQGNDFPVIKIVIDDQDIDFSLPRSEIKTGAGHKGFDVSADPEMTTKTASLRRDFTINSLMTNTITGECIDHNGGAADLEGRILRHVSPKFSEDPLRVLRGMQFIARFDLTPDPETIDLCRSLSGEFPSISKSRLFAEFEKLLMKGEHPGKGIMFLKDCEWIKHFPILAALDGVEQNPDWHPEGDAFVHTCHVMDQAAIICREKGHTGDDRMIVMLSAMLHDIGKPATSTRLESGKIVSPKHEAVGAEMVGEFMEYLGVNRFNAPVKSLVKYHMVNPPKPNNRFIVRMSRKLNPATTEQLGMLIIADKFGRPPLPKIAPRVAEMLIESSHCPVIKDQLKPIVLGKDLMGLGVAEGPEIGRLKKICLDAQDSGLFSNKGDGIAFAKREINHQQRKT